MKAGGVLLLFLNAYFETASAVITYLGGISEGPVIQP